MQVRRIAVTNFRGVQRGQVLLDGHTLLVGGNSVGKSTLCEALDLVLGPERMYRRPVIDEYDFYGARYLDDSGLPVAVEIEVVLIDLSEAAERRFSPFLRKWDPATNDFADVDPGVLSRAEDLPWCLPVTFCGRFNAEEDDFEGGTFFSHPEPVVDDLTLESERLGGGRKPFTREDKRHCGYLYLRPNRTGSRALSLQRGSLLDTIVRLESDAGVTLWEKLRADLAVVDLAPDESKLADILDGVATRIGHFLALGSTDGIQIHASDLTRENIREVLRVFIASQPGTFPVPFSRLSTGSLNLLVFALLTYIAELKSDASVIFAIEEPEIALPPHSQRRLVDFALAHMGQVIVTSHSPYVIERFEPGNILVLDRDDAGRLRGGPVTLPTDFKLKRYRENRRQFAEAVLARAVLVVEGGTEAALVPIVADILDAERGSTYTHPDLAGVSVLDAGSDVSVPLYAPLFRSLGKPVYGMHDTPNTPFTPELQAKTDDFTRYTVIGYAGIEDLLIAEMPTAVKHRFLIKAAERADYPGGCAAILPDADAAAVDTLLRQVLKARKGATWRYAADLVAEAAGAAELPQSIVTVLRDIDTDLAATATTPPGPGDVRGAEVEPETGEAGGTDDANSSGAASNSPTEP